ncbi:hypothetical protein BKA56DRAFT_615579 [Ilyonectria sp. MPI-CAGE-AT-0026]|nr:hypothetical protein BKA56DRAFT_615579 [Ilyonectria sp. MPI-CAGE-AT-0026]
MSTTPEALTRLSLWIDPATNLLICTQPKCKYALSTGPSCVVSHLWDKHDISTKARKGLSESIITFPTALDEFKSCSSPRYHYTPITQPKCIRLLKLELISGEIYCILETVRIDEAPPYWALSYI